MNEKPDPPEGFSIDKTNLEEILSGKNRREDDNQDLGTSCTCLLVIVVLVLAFLRDRYPALFVAPTPTHTWETPTLSATLVPSETPAPIGTLAPKEKIYETTWQGDRHFQGLTQDGLLRIGSMSLRFEPDTLRLLLSIKVPPEFVNEDLFSFERILLPPVRISDLYTTRTNAPGIDGCLLTSNILVYPVMDADVTSPDFVIESFDPGAPQVLDVTQPYSRVLWEWSLSRHYTDEGLVSLWIYLNEIPEPSWSCTFLLDMSR